MNDLVDSAVSVAVWLPLLPRVSARLYELAPAVWDEFEPARKQFTEAMAWLEWEGKLTLSSTSVTDAVQTLQRSLPEREKRWQAAAQKALEALGSAMLRDLLRP